MEYHRCRLCLEDTDKFMNIFQDTFPEMILILTGLKIEQNDGFPNMACYQCHQEVKSAMLTRYQIINSNKVLLEELNNKLDKFVDKNKHQLQKKNDSSDTNLDSDYCNDSDTVLAATESDSNIKEDRKEKLNNNKQIKFRKKLKGQDKPIKKRSLILKVQYDIKPEHLEFLKSVGRKDRVPCPDCGRVMFGMNMKNHLITHKYDPVKCEVCGKTSKNAQALQDHINYYHKTTPDRFICDKCGKGYRVRFMLLKHEKKEHGSGEKDYECSICGKKFFENLHLKNHINITHKKIKAYKCEHCGKDFGRRTQFVTHQLVHTKENRYHCQICGKGFKIKQTMQTHLKGVHEIEEEQTVFCTICQKGFSTSQGLRAHINSRVHGLEKCDLCSEFITVEYKSVHMKDAHGMEKT